MDRKPIGGANMPNIRNLADDILDEEANRNFRMQLFRDIIEEEDEDILNSTLSDHQFDRDDSVERAMLDNAMRPHYRPIERRESHGDLRRQPSGDLVLEQPRARRDSLDEFVNFNDLRENLVPRRLT